MYNISQNNTRSEYYRTHKYIIKAKQSDIHKCSILPLSRVIYNCLIVKPVYNEVLQ